MKFSGSFALALLAITALVDSVVAISGVNLSMVANSYSGSSFVATFVDNSGIDEFNQILNFDAIFPGDLDEYANMNCVTELDVESNHSASVRVIGTPVTEYRHQTAGYVGFKAALRLGSGEILGKFKLACTFTPLKRPTNGLNTVVYASINQDEGFAFTSGTIRPFTGLADKFDVYVPKSLPNYTSAQFAFYTINSTIDGNKVRVQSPSATSATTGSAIVFKSTSETSYCDAKWDDTFYERSVTVTVAEDGSYVELTFGSAINAASRRLAVYCGEVTGQKNNPFLPAILEAVYTGSRGVQYANYAIASTSVDQVSFDDALDQINDIL